MAELQNNIEQDELVMRFDPNTIAHLGIQMYSTLPPVVAELIANSYDAEAEKVTIELYDTDEKRIVISDDGHGMKFEEINDHFLMIGRNRREDPEGEKSKNGLRYVIGKKGIGKLAFFGISERIEISTTCEGLRNTFILDWGKIKNWKVIVAQATEQEEEVHEEDNNAEKTISEESETREEMNNKDKTLYKPDIKEYNVQVEEENGTIITLSIITRKSAFDPNSLAISLARSFQIFDQKDFDAEITHNSDENVTKIENELRYSNIEVEYKNEFPLLEKDQPHDYEYYREITGNLFAAKETIPSKMRGVALFSRGKLVNRYEFYEVKATSHGYSYITGWLNVDFIEDFHRDVIGTNRQSLNWELEETQELQAYLQEVIKGFYNIHREWRKNQKKEEIKKSTGIDIDQWIKDLPGHEGKLAKKIIDSIIGSEGIGYDKACELVKFTRDSFQFEAFKELANDLEDSSFENTELILELFKEWEVIETKELYKIAQVRIETIMKFGKLIEENAKEVPEIHNFFKKFSWILDPRIMNFEDEVTYSDLLREQFKDDNLDEKDRRIDFLCQDFIESLFIIELKRPKAVIGKNELEQALDYVSFMRKKIGNENTKNIYCYIIGNRLANTDIVQMMAESYKSNKLVYFKPYEELLKNARNYHKEFIDRYDKMTQNSG